MLRTAHFKNEHWIDNLTFVTGGIETPYSCCGSGYLETLGNLGIYRQLEEKEEIKPEEKTILKYENSILTPLIPIIEIEADRVKRN